MGTRASELGDVRAMILRQHEEIRARLHSLDAATTIDPETAAAYLRVSLLRWAALFEVHLTFEELHLGPRLREVDAWGSAREAAMRAEHVEQRTRLEDVCAAVEDEETPAGEVSRMVSQLVVTFLDDMAREERELAELEGIDTYGVVDQMTG